MKVLIIGGTGAIGQAVVKELSVDHSLIIAARTHGDIQVDITDEKSIEKMYQTAGKIDAVVSTTGQVHFAALSEVNFQIGLHNKLMGQVNLVLIGLKYLNDSGSFTLTSGILSHDPIRYGASASMVNGAIDSFVKAAAIELPRNIRINAISPTVLTESMDKFGEYFKGYESVPAEKVALAYRKSIDGAQTGMVYKIW